MLTFKTTKQTSEKETGVNIEVKAANNINTITDTGRIDIKSNGAVNTLNAFNLSSTSNNENIPLTEKNHLLKEAIQTIKEMTQAAAEV
ncbi:MAG: hypothetical protein ACK4PR_08120, partial [Gammaproteobacteria bacterium]